jgi:integrase
MRFNNANVATLAIAAGKSERIEFDDDLPGFGVRLRAGGKRTWLVQYRVGKQQRRVTLGTVQLIDADKARKLAKDALAKVQLGGDPQAAKIEQKAKAAETFGVFAARFLERQKARLKPRSLEQVATHLTKHWSPLNVVSIHSIAKRDVASLLGKIASERGDFAANRARTSLSGFFAWAIGEGIVDANPVAGTNKSADENKRERVLTDAELADVWNACRSDDFGRIVRLLILTGVRRDEAGGMVKGEVDLAARKLSVGAERTKNRRPHDVPLSDLALDILGAAIGREGNAVFGDGGADRGFSGWSKAKLTLDARIAAARKADGREPIEPWILHDLRRSAATRMADLGVLPHVVEALLNHVSGHKAGVAGVYNRAVYWNEKRQALDLWAAHVEALVAGAAASNVVALRA